MGTGVRTFTSRRLAPYRLALGADSFAGWTSPHACVTALVGTLPDAPASLFDALRAQQLPDGRWPSYWWEGDEYATALAIEALRTREDPVDAPRVKRAGIWLASRVSSEGCAAGVSGGSASATAWTLRGLVAAESSPDVARACVRWIERAQLVDGSWSASSWMRIVPMDVEEPACVPSWERGLGAPGGVIVDARSLLTGAACVAALAIAEGA